MVISLSKVALWAGFIIALIIVGVAAYYAGTMSAPTPTGTITTPPPYTPPEKVRAAFIYVGPVGDFGWTYAHDLGRRVSAELFKDWLETTYIESVPEGQEKEKIETLISQGYNVIFTTSFGFMEGTLDEAKIHPDIMFFHCSGYLRYKNMGTYFADFYQIYYLNGLLAGALTKTGHIGYIGAFFIPEVTRHMNAFAIGAKEIGDKLGKNITVYAIELGAWFAPDKARQAAQTLVNQYDVDVIAFTEDSTAIIEYAQQLYEQEGKQIYVFSHYSPGWVYGKDVVVSGQLVRWEVIYADILSKIKAGIYTPTNLENVDYWYLLNSGAVEFGGHIFPNGSVMYINPKFDNELKSIIVHDDLTGRDEDVYTYTMLRYEIMKNAPIQTPLQAIAPHKYENLTSIEIGGQEGTYYIAPPVDPFIGPISGYKISDPSQKVNIPAGVRLGHDDLWSMDWFVDWVVLLGG